MRQYINQLIRRPRCRRITISIVQHKVIRTVSNSARSIADGLLALNHRSFHWHGSGQRQFNHPWVICSLAGSAIVLLAAEEESPNINIDGLKEISVRDEQMVVAEADVLYSQNQTDVLCDYLKGYSDSRSAQIHWRLARAIYDKSKQCEAKSSEKKSLVYEAFGYARRGLIIDDKCGACHRWYGVLLSDVGEYEGIKQKIKNSYMVRDHFKRAIELNPKDATSMYALGFWCFFVADMSWYTQKVASVIFATPPTSTFQEALNYFLMAESVDPDFYSMNHLMIAKTYLKLHDKIKAKEHLVMARDLPVRSVDDKRAHAESIDLLCDLRN